MTTNAACQGARPASGDAASAGVVASHCNSVPWLEAIAAALASNDGQAVVATCSALKRCYRDRLRDGAGPLIFIFPRVPRDALAQRMAARSGHYMPPVLLDSQLADLEPLAEGEKGFSVEGTGGLPAQLDAIRSRLGL